MTGRSELRVHRVAKGDSARPLRHALASFMKAAQVDEDTIDDIVTAVGEALANAIEHAYDDGRDGRIELYVRLAEPGLAEVQVCDEGTFIQREDRQGRGFGLRIVRSIARSVSIDTSGGTTVHMLFNAPRTEPAA